MKIYRDPIIQYYHTVFKSHYDTTDYCNAAICWLLRSMSNIPYIDIFFCPFHLQKLTSVLPLLWSHSGHLAPSSGLKDGWFYYFHTQKVEFAFATFLDFIARYRKTLLYRIMSVLSSWVRKYGCLRTTGGVACWPAVFRLRLSLISSWSHGWVKSKMLWPVRSICKTRKQRI